MTKTQHRGVVRVLDRLGRVTVPMEIRKAFGWKIADEIEFAVDGDSVRLKSLQSEQRQRQAIEKLKLVVANVQDENVKKQVEEAIYLVEGDLEWNYNQ